MEKLYHIDWQQMFVPDSSVLEMALRGTIMYLAMFALLRVFRRQAGSVSVADLLLIKPGARPSPRRVVARSCAQAADAAALIIAVSFDPGALTEDRTSTETDLQEAPARPPERAEPAAASRDTSEPPQRDVRAQEEATSPVSDSWSAPVRYRFGVDVAGQAVFGPAPGSLPGVGVYVVAAIERGGYWSPALQLGGMHVGRAGFEATGGEAAFTLDAVTLDLCVLRFGTGTFHVRACGSGMLGRLAVCKTQDLI
jgi:hypothetical protein